MELVSVRKIGPGLHDVDDWQLLLALHRDARPWDGLITCDAQMLSQAREMVALQQTQLTLVVTESGSNPVRAVGTLLCHLTHICSVTTPDRAQVWRVKVSQKHPDTAQSFLERIAERQGESVANIWAANKLTNAQLLNGPGDDE